MGFLVGELEGVLEGVLEGFFEGTGVPEGSQVSLRGSTKLKHSLSGYGNSVFEKQLLSAKVTHIQYVRNEVIWLTHLHVAKKKNSLNRHQFKRVNPDSSAGMVPVN